MLARGVPAAGIPPSAAHRLLIWDFVILRIAERPLLGWGMEASRSLPGHATTPPGGPGPLRPGWRRDARLAGRRAELLPLHPHNGALQLRLELGWPGVLLAALLARRPGAGQPRRRGTGHARGRSGHCDAQLRRLAGMVDRRRAAGPRRRRRGAAGTASPRLGNPVAGDFAPSLAAERHAPSAPELYVAPLYDHLIRRGQRIHDQRIDAADVVFCGVPAEYEALLASGDSGG